MGSRSQLSVPISQLAARQLGSVTWAQMRGLGAGRSWIGRRVREGWLIRSYAGVYWVGHHRVDPPARAMAVVLAGGPTALLSDDSAAALWGWRPPPAVPEITIVGDRRPKGIRVHRTRTRRRDDATTHLGVPITSPQRTLADIRGRLSDEQFRRIVSQARIDRRLSAEAAEHLLGGGPAPTRSVMQDRFQTAVLDAHRLPQPLTDTRVNGYEVDAVWPAERVIVELDGWEFHRDRRAFAVDRERDAVHAEHGFVVVRITWERLRDAPRREAQRLRRIVAARGI